MKPVLALFAALFGGRSVLGRLRRPKALVLLSAMASGCVEPGVCGGVDLVQVQTIDEESDEMRRFAAECRPLSMRIFDASGQAIPFSDPQWMTKVHHVDLSGRGSRLFQHTVLDGKNVGHLMGE